MKSWRLRRDSRISFKFLTEELRLEDKNAYRQYIRMDEACFKKLLGYIETDILKKNTIMRDSVPPEECLTAVLRFLATSESYRSLEFQTRLSLTFLSRAIPKICGLIYKNMKEDYLKVFFFCFIFFIDIHIHIYLYF